MFSTTISFLLPTINVHFTQNHFWQLLKQFGEHVINIDYSFLSFFLYAILAKDFNPLLNVWEGIIDQRLLTVSLMKAFTSGHTVATTKILPKYLLL